MAAPNCQFATSRSAGRCAAACDDLPAAHQHRHGVGTDGDGEDERAGEDAGHREEGDREEGPPAAGAETPGRLFQRRSIPWMMPIRERIMKGRLSWTSPTTTPKALYISGNGCGVTPGAGARR